MDCFFQFLDCLANPTRHCLINPLFAYVVAGVFLVSIACGWSAPKTFKRVSMWVFVGALSLVIGGAVAVVGWRLIRGNSRWLGPVTENLGSLAFVLLGSGLVLLAIAVGFAVGRWLKLRGTKGMPPGGRS